MSGLRLAFISFIRRPVSSLLAVLSLTIPLTAAGLLVTVLSYSREGIRQYDRTIDAIVGAKTPGLELVLSALLGIGHEDGIIPYELLRHAREPMDRKRWVRPLTGTDDTMEVVKQATPIMDFATGEGYRVIATDRSFLQRPDAEMEEPSVGDGQWFYRRGQMVAGSEVARRRNLIVGSMVEAVSIWTHPDTGEPLWRKEMVISGILEPTGLVYDRQFYTALEEAFEMYRLAIPLDLLRQVRDEMGMSYMLIWLHEGQEDRLRDFFDNYTVAQTFIVSEQMELLERLIGGGAIAGRFIGGITALLGLLCVMVLFNARFEGMGEDLAVMKSLGYGNAQVAGWLLFEALLVWICALPLAILVEWIAVGWIVGLPGITLFDVTLPWPTSFHPWLWGLTLIGCPLAILIPLIRLYRHNVHDALKGM